MGELLEISLDFAIDMAISTQQRRRYGWGGGGYGFGTTRSDKTMEKGRVPFKHSSRSKFSPFFAKLLATNCCTLMRDNNLSYYQAYTDVSRNRGVSVEYRYRYFVSDYVLKQYVKTFFKRLVVLVFFRAHSKFFLGRSQLRNQGKGASAPFSQVAKKIQPPNTSI